MDKDKGVLKNHFLKIFRHMKWSDIKVLNLLEEENIRGGKTVELLSHILIAEDTWLKRIKGEFYDNQFWKLLKLEECRTLVENTNLNFMKYIKSLAGSDFQKMISYRNSRGADYITSIEDILTHVGFHGMYHRGQIMMLMRNSGQDIIATDYVMFIREDEHEEK